MERDDPDYVGRVSCPVCMDTLGEGATTEWAALQCGHCFHQGCLLQALEHNPVCPTCRVGGWVGGGGGGLGGCLQQAQRAQCVHEWGR